MGGPPARLYVRLVAMRALARSWGRRLVGRKRAVATAEYPVTILTLCLVLMLAGPLAVGGSSFAADASAQQDGPTLSVTVDGTTVSEDQVYPVMRDPPMHVEAAASDGETIDLVVVEVDGSVYREYDVDAESVSRELTPEVTGGEHDVEVIVRSSSGAITSLPFVVRKDTGGPYVWLTRPYETEPRRGTIDDGSVEDAMVAFEGRIDEPTGPTRIRLTRTHLGTDRTEAVRGTHDGSFAYDILLGVGDNKISIVAEDDLGNVRSYEFTVTVDDTEPPDVSMDAPRTTSEGELSVEFTVTDNVWVNKSTFMTEDFTAPDVVRYQQYNPNEDRRSVTFTRSVSLRRGENRIRVWAEDYAGNEIEETFVIERTGGADGYRRPAISFDSDATELVGAETLAVAGRITGTSISSVTIESTIAGGEERLDYQFIHRGDPVDEISFEKEVTVGEGESVVVVRAEDESGNVTTAEVEVDADSGRVALPERDSDGPGVASDGDQSGDDAGDSGSDGDGGEPGTDGDDSGVEDARVDVSDDSRVLLDGEWRLVGDYAVEGERYRVYRVENALPFASGVEVFHEGEPVTDPSEARAVLNAVAADRVLTTRDYEVSEERVTGVTSRSAADDLFEELAWRRAVERVDESELEAMRATVAVARDIQRTTASVGNAIDSILGVVDGMKSTSLVGVTAWDLAVNVAPQLEPFVDSLESLRTELREWERAADRVTTTLPAAIDGIERAKAGEDVDYDRVAGDLGEAMGALDQLRAQSDELEDRFRRIGETSSTIASLLGRESRLGAGLSSSFDSFGRTMNGHADDVDQFGDGLDQQATQLGEVRSFGRNEHDRLLDSWEEERAELREDWESRQSAETAVYGALGGSAVIFGGIGFFLWRRWL